MNGKIIIDVFDHGVFGVDVDVPSASQLDRFLMVDCLVEALDFNDEERLELGAIIAIGGFKMVMGEEAVAKMALPDALVELIKKKKGNEK